MSVTEVIPYDQQKVNEYIMTLKDLADLFKTGRTDIVAPASTVAAAYSHEINIFDGESRLPTDVYVQYQDSVKLITLALFQVAMKPKNMNKDALVNILSAVCNFSSTRPGSAALANSQESVDFTIFALIRNEFASLRPFYAGILANISRNEQHVRTILGVDRDILYIRRTRELKTLLTKMLEQKQELVEEETDSNTDSWENAALYFSNISRIPEGQRPFLDDGCRLLRDVLELITFPSTVRRVAAVHIMKHCTMREVNHEELTRTRDLYAKILLPLMAKDVEYKKEELDASCDIVKAVARKIEDGSIWERESELEVRKAIVDTFLLLCQSRKGRDLIRNLKAYPVLRAYHVVEEDTEISAKIELIVEKTELLEEEEKN